VELLEPMQQLHAEIIKEMHVWEDVLLQNQILPHHLHQQHVIAKDKQD
jgi:hypothetical protein